MRADKTSANTARTTCRCLSKRPSKGTPCEPRFSRAGVAAFGVAGAQPQYVEAAERLWRNMVTRRLYITGGVGAIARDEKFGGDFVLPNDGYLETCAAVACGFLDYNLFLATADAAKVDELERSLYNGALAGVSLKGNAYFYENPLDAGRNRARWSWHACPCCPPMFLKLMGALPGYIYATDADGLYVNLFIGSRAQIGLEGEKGKRLSLTQTTNYPWDGDVRLAVDPERPATFDVRVRVPAWCRGGVMNGGLYTMPKAGPDAFRISINGEPVASPTIVRGYAVLRRQWRGGQGPHPHGDAGAAREGRRPRRKRPRSCRPHAWADRVLPRVP